MKLITILIFVGTIALSASSYSKATKIDLQLRDSSSLKDIFRSIEKVSEFIFIYDANTINTDVKRIVSAKGERIEIILDKLFQKTDMAYLIDDRQVFLYKKDDLKTLALLNSNIKVELQQAAQKIPITGTVADSTSREPLPGVNVVVQGTVTGTSTDAAGKFSLSVPDENAVLEFTFIGYVKKTMTVGKQRQISISLRPDLKALEEVMVVGYGVQKKESVLGAISQTTSEQLQRTGGVTDFMQTLTGQLPGVITIVSTGEPGGMLPQNLAGNTIPGAPATSIFVRGQNTWNGGSALILVDGVERSSDNLDVSEVESVSVLKDASATAVYGVQGANGVILITTKRGALGKPKISFSYNTTAKSLSKVPKIMDSYNAILIRDEAIEREVVLNEPSWGDYIPYEIATRYQLPQKPEYTQIYPNVNWKEAMYKDLGFSHRATVNIQGGTDFVNYFASLSYLHEGDMFKKYENHKGYDPSFNFDRFNFRSNLDFKLTKTTKAKVNLSGYYSEKNFIGNPGDIWSALYSVAPDLYLPQYPDGRWGWSSNVANPNPAAHVWNQGVNVNHETTLNSNFALEQNLDFITKGLSAEASLFYDNTISSSSGITDGAVRPGEQNSNTPLKEINSALYTGPDQDPSEYTKIYPTLGTNRFDWTLIPWQIYNESIGNISRRMIYQFQTNYNRKFGLHNISAMGLVKRSEFASGSMFKNYREDWVFRATYDYDTRYLFEMNGAYNGSEQFGPGYRFDFFPSVALGWVVSNEKFFKVDWINKLKLRYSIGMVGNDNLSGGRWLYNTQLSYGGHVNYLNQNVGWDSPGSPYTFYKESMIGNPDIHWEIALKKNYGLEMGLFNNLITVTYDYFTDDRTDMLISGSNRNIPPFFGAIPPSANDGSVKSKGHDLELRFDTRRNNRSVHYWATLAFSHTENEVLEKDDPILEESYLKAKGFSIGQTRTQVRAGFYNNWDEIYASVPLETNDLTKIPGFYNILDFNADGLIKTNDAVPVGYSIIPQNTFSFLLGADYKGLSIMVQFYGVNNVSRSVPLNSFGGADIQKKQDIVFDNVSDYWSKDNQDATSFLPRWKTTGEKIGDYFLFDASYLRLKTAEIAYTFQDKWVKKAGLSALKIFLNGNNLLFWSKLPDDREASFVGGGDSGGTYPTVKLFNIGVDLTF